MNAPAGVQVDREARNWPHRTLAEWADDLGLRNGEVAAARAILGKEESSHQEVLAAALAGVLRAIARDHDANDTEFCETCGTSWPCDLAGYTLDSLAALAPLLGPPEAHHG